jgi:UPF0042 nucleotide-binding protein
MHLVIVSGLSGSGKSVTIKSFEDGGFYCVDNLPIALLLPLQSFIVQNDIERVALGIDIRERGSFTSLFAVLDGLRQHGHNVELIFLEARDEVLIRRYSETRRRHPLTPFGLGPESIMLEREKLAELRQRATRIVDTSELTVHELRTFIQQVYTSQGNIRLHVIVGSFGFKYGVPSNTDLVFDVRFLPNPHFEPALCAFTGCDARVAQYVLGNTVGRNFLKHLLEFLSVLMPLYEQEGKSYLTISIGCTGGKHRSVAIAEKVEQHLLHLGYPVICKHRDVTKAL